MISDFDAPHLLRRRDSYKWLAALLLTTALLAGCNVEHRPENAPENATPAQSPAANGSPAKTWTEIPTANALDRVTVHYHRAGNDYAGAGLWTWDVYQKHTPARNEVMPVGQDDFGAVFQFDRAQYGESGKIGLLPRMSRDWTRKDGPDRIWTPSLGNQVWILSGKPGVLPRRPDLTPRLEAAYADKENEFELRTSQPVALAALGIEHIHISDELGHDAPMAQRTAYRTEEWQGLQSAGGTRRTSQVQITGGTALDFAAHTYQASVDGLGAPQPLVPRGLLDDPRLYYRADAILGAAYSPGETVFRVFAPTARTVDVVLYDAAAGNEGRKTAPMHTVAKGIWEAAVPGDLAGRFYMLLPRGGGLPGEETLDPYATNAVDSSTRARITPPTPAPPPLVRRPEAPEDMVIYEMHVRDFTIDANSGIGAPGLYMGWTQGNARLVGDANIKTGVDHLAELGVTHVQIMPVQDFANDETVRAYNWGYITTAFFSPEGMYASNPADDSRVYELKALIAALHQRGIGAIMDVVYNHTADSAPFEAMVPNYYYRRLPDGTPANGSGCGNEFRSEAPMARKYILDSLKYWAREYGVDGFRFDLMALIDRETMTQIANELRAINPAIAIYGEPWTGGDSPLAGKTDKNALREVPAGAFNDDFRNALKGPPEGSGPGFIQNGSNREGLEKAMMVSDWFAGPGQSINYMTCHDNLVLWDKLKLSMPGASDDLLKRTAKIGYLVLLTSQGVPFMQGGEEFGRTKGGDDNSYASPDSVNEVDWSLKEKNHDLFTYVRVLIALRKAHPLFRLRTREEIRARLRFLPSESGLAYEIDGNGVPGENWNEALVIVNPDDKNPMRMPLPGGDWEAACDERGATMGRTMNGSATVPAKSGLVLFKQ